MYVVGGSNAGGSLGTLEVFTPTAASLPTLTSIAVTPANPTINVGQTQQFPATGTFEGEP
ncbi:MAG: hypothetical protein ACR2L2_12195 [Acidobacteriota bacterium]